MPEQPQATGDPQLQALIDTLVAANIPVTVSYAASLEGVVAAHPGDQARVLGVVLLADEARPLHLMSAYYMRPVERDAGGHLQRRPPALLASWDAAASRYDHFAWAVTDELAARAGMTRADFEAEVRRRGSEQSARL